MSSYVIVELDTTAPQIAIYAPRYTTADIVNEITVQSNEVLSDYQDIYAIDSVGVRHDYTFQRMADDQFVGLVRFNNFPFGIATVYARLKDDVDNYSETAFAAIEVNETSPSLTLDISWKQRKVIDEFRTMRLDVNDRVRKVWINNVGKDDAR